MEQTATFFLLLLNSTSSLIIDLHNRCKRFVIIDVILLIKIEIFSVIACQLDRVSLRSISRLICLNSTGGGCDVDDDADYLMGDQIQEVTVAIWLSHTFSGKYLLHTWMSNIHFEREKMKQNALHCVASSKRIEISNICCMSKAYIYSNGEWIIGARWNLLPQHYHVWYECGSKCDVIGKVN